MVPAALCAGAVYVGLRSAGTCSATQVLALYAAI